MHNTTNYVVVYIRLPQTNFENGVGISTQICKTEDRARLLRDQYRQIWGEKMAEYYELKTIYGDDGTFTSHYRGYRITGNTKTESVTLINRNGRSYMQIIKNFSEALDYVNLILLNSK